MISRQTAGGPAQGWKQFCPRSRRLWRGLLCRGAFTRRIQRLTTASAITTQGTRRAWSPWVLTRAPRRRWSDATRISFSTSTSQNGASRRQVRPRRRARLLRPAQLPPLGLISPRMGPVRTKARVCARICAWHSWFRSPAAAAAYTCFWCVWRSRKILHSILEIS